ncbi:serine protease [Kribbella sp. NPDC003505]|uniref:S1 family peptidase n=1 Tax=Kribbella sp. NPDC003505 TaxID=3154448 RepID=UPI0033BE12BA
MDERRIVETHSPAIRKRGSGYLVTDRMVLTAAHCVGHEIGETVRIRRFNESQWEVGLLRWSGQRNGIDAALVEMEPAALRPDDAGKVVRFGTPIGVVEWQAIGFPRFNNQGRVTENESARGRLDPITKSRVNPQTGRRELYALDSGLHVRATPSRSDAAWSGMSGSAVIADGHLIAIVVEEDAQVGARLLGVPIEWVLSDEDAAQWLNQDGRHIRPEPLWGDTQLLEHPVRPLEVDADSSSLSRAVMLQARRRVVERTGRDAELESLRRWCNDRDALPVQLAIGDTGAGKTRLAVELAVAQADDGWLCGFVADHALSFGRLLELSTSRLLIVDDAVRHLDQLRALLKEADSAEADGSDARRTWRLLVLARPPYQRWWRSFENEFASLIEPSPIYLTPLPVVGRQLVYEVARRQFGEWLSPDRGSWTVPTLEDPVYESYLAILERALLDCDPNSTLNGDVDQQLASRLLRLEAETYWLPEARSAGIDADVDLLERIAAVCSLAFADGRTTEESEASAARALCVLPDLADAPQQIVRKIARWQRSLYETGAGYLRPLRPHRLATEAAQRLAVDSPQVVGDLLSFSNLGPTDGTLHRFHQEAAVAQATRLLSTLLPAVRGDASVRPEPSLAEVLERVCLDHLEGLVELAVSHAQMTPLESSAGQGLSLEALLAELLRLVPSPQRAAAVVNGIPVRRNLRLDDLVVVLQSQAVAAYRDDADSAGERLADALEKLAHRQTDIRALDEARESLQEALDLRTALLGQYSSRTDLLEGQQHQLRIRRAQEQIRICSARSRLANLLCDLDLRAEAVVEATEAHEVLGMIDGSADVFDLHKRVSLEVSSNLSRALRRAGHRTSAFEFSAIAERHAEDLFNDDPQEYHHWYAMALRRSSAALSDVGKVKPALSKATEAVKHFDVMARRDPHAWAFDAAKARRNLAERLHDSGRWQEAEDVAWRAVDLWRTLVSGRASVYNLELTKAMVVVVRARMHLEDPAQAEQTAREIDYETEPRTDGERDTLAQALAARAQLGSMLGEHLDAQRMADRSIELVMAQSESFGQLKLVHLAVCNFTSAACLIATDREQARRRARDAEALCTRLQADDPADFPAILRDARKHWNDVSTTKNSKQCR